MTLNLGLPFLLLFLSVLATVAVTIARPRYACHTALAGAALLCFTWLVARSALPMTLVFGPQATAWPAWTWQVDDLGWAVSLGVLLLALGALALEARRPDLNRLSDPAFIHLIAFVALLACWAGSLATYVLAWTLLNGVWLAGLALAAFSAASPARAERLAALPSRLGAALVSILLLWLASASAGAGAALSSAATWSLLTQLLILLAATYQLGVFPFHLWRFEDWDAPVGRAALLHTAPAAAGGLLLARLESASDIGLAFALPFTLLGLLALLAGARRAWTAGDRRFALPLALIQAQSGLVLLAGVWAGPQAVLAETTVLLLAGGVLLLSRARSPEPLRLPQPGPLIAVAALAAAPLTAGFTGRSAVYGAWLDQGHWLLVLVTALLHIPLALAALHALWTLPRAGEAPGDVAARPSQIDLARLLALLLPALGLFSIAAIARTAPLAWLAILLPPLSAALLAWRIEETGAFVTEARQILRDAFAAPLAAQPAWQGVRRAVGAVAAATREALFILEGEGGLLWLFVFVIILYLVR